MRQSARYALVGLLLMLLASPAAASDTKTIRVYVVNDSARGTTYAGHAEAHTAWLIGEVNQLFQGGGFAPEIRISLVGQRTWKDDRILDVSRQSDGRDAMELFKAFRSWASTSDLPRRDLTLLLTGDRLHEGMAGQGGSRTMCLPDKAVAAVRVDGAKGDPAIVARYIAYAIGIRKDGDPSCEVLPGSDDDDVMGALRRERLSTTWSPCSRAAWTKFLTKVYRGRKPCLETDAPPATRFGAEPRPPVGKARPRPIAPPVELSPPLPGARPGHRPRPMQALNGVRTVELHVVNDAARARVYGDNTEAHTRWLVGEVNALFAQGGFDPPVRIALAGQATWRGGDKRGVARAWKKNDPRAVRRAFVRDLLPQARADMPILLTPRSLGRSLAGWGTVGTMCTHPRENAAVIKVDGSSTDVSNVARFVAQALGISADPAGTACAKTRHIMSDVLNVRRPPTVWSGCSKKAFRTFLATNDVRCLDNPARPASRTPAPAPAFDLGPPRDEPASLLREWPRYGRGHDVPRGVVVDDLVYIRGAARPRVPLRGSVGVFARFMRPRDTLIFNVAHAKGDARVDLTADGHLKSLDEPPQKGWLAFDGIVYGLRGHQPLVLRSGWANRRGFAPAHYVANSGVVVLGGVIAGDGRETILTTLPKGHRPRQMTPFVVRADTGAVRVIVDTDGRVRLSTRMSPKWVSLSGITFAPGPSTRVPMARPQRVENRPASHKAGPMVHLTGDVLAKGKTLLRLPSALWPTHTQAFVVPTEDGFVRVRVTKRGRVELVARAKSRDDRVIELDGVIYHAR